MEVTGTRIETSPRSGYVRIIASVTYDTGDLRAEEYWFEYPERVAEHLESWGDPWLACLLPLAATLGEDLRIALPVDEVLLGNTERLQEIWRCWHPHLHPVKVVARTAVPRVAGVRRTASFFSGGVDSFFTALKHRRDGERLPSARQPAVDDLFCVWGFDIPLDNAPAFERVRASLVPAGAALGLRLLDIATNLRETRWQATNWPELAHGAALAAVALCLGAGYATVYVPSTDSYNQLYPWGSHALTDPLFGTSRTTVVHDGAEASRFQKIAAIVRNESALRSLRVCWRSKSDQNCGRCQKCYRTMLALELLGALERTPAFGGNQIDLGLVRRIFIEWDLVGDYRELREMAAAQGRTDIARAIGQAFWRSRGIVACNKVAGMLEKAPAMSGPAKIFRRLARFRTVT